MSSIQATRLRKGMLIKVANDLFRVLDLHHLTPGNKRGFVQCRLRNIRSGSLSDQKFRSEEDVERATLDERVMQYLYSDGSAYYFMDTTNFEQLQMSAELLGESVHYLVADSVITAEFYGFGARRCRAAADRRPQGRGDRPGHQGGHGQRAGEARPTRNRAGHPGSALRQHRRRGSREHGYRGVSVSRLSLPASAGRRPASERDHLSRFNPPSQGRGRARRARGRRRTRSPLRARRTTDRRYGWRWTANAHGRAGHCRRGRGSCSRDDGGRAVDRVRGLLLHWSGRRSRSGDAA